MSFFKLIAVLLAAIDTKLAKKAIDSLLDALEDFIEKTETEWDDKLALPFILLFRRVMDIPDNDTRGGKLKLSRTLLDLLPILLGAIPKEAAKKAIDSLLDTIEDAVGKSKTQWDDILVLPFILLLRRALSIPDND